MNDPQKQMTKIRVLTLLALLLMVAAYFSPVWWVSLTAPNYPKDAFPDGIRIHFHFDGVFNGCNSQPVSGGRHDEIIQYDLGDDLAMRDDPSKAKNEKQVVGLDCVHEMNTINHYVGMYPIATGAPVEVPMSKFIIGMFAVMLLGSMVSQKRRQMMILGAGFTAVSVWMVGDLYVMGNLASFADHYYKEASTFFNQPDILARWVANLKTATAAAVAGLMVSMLIIVLGVWKLRSFALLLALVPALLPVFFVLDYAGWLWFFGHNLHPWGAFTVKPFMPTVFGEGKVAQFSTYSYPYYGYAMLVASGLLLALAVLIRRKLQHENRDFQ